MTTSAATRLRQHQRVTPLAGALARMGAGDPAAFVTTRAPFTGTLAMTAGAGSISHSRADTFAPTTADHAGIVRTCRQGEVRFWGLRRIENLATYSENPGAWAASSTSGTGVTPLIAASSEPAPTTGSAALPAAVHRVVLDSGAGGTTSDWSLWSFLPAGVVGRRYTWSVWLKAATPSDVGKVVGVCGPAQSAYYPITLTATWARYQTSEVAYAAYASVVLALRGGLGMSASASFFMAGLQIEDTTNQTDTTAGEYVSTGVASGPAYHGANVDGVRYYATAQDGSAITGGGLLIEGAAQQLLASTDMTSGWTGYVSATHDGTYALGMEMAKLAKTLSSSNESWYSAINGGSALSAGWYCVRFCMLASANSSSASAGLLGLSSTWGLNADAVIAKISGPATVTQAGGAIASISGLSTTVPTVFEIKKNVLSSEVSLCMIYPDGAASSTAGRAIYAAVGNVEAGSMCTSRIVTSGTMLTRAADVPTLPTAGNLCAEWGAMSATITLPSSADAGVYRTVLGTVGEWISIVYLYDSGGGAAGIANPWMSTATPWLTIPGYPASRTLKIAAAWRNATTTRLCVTGASATESTATAEMPANLPANLILGSVHHEGINPLNGVIRDLCFYGLDLTTTQLATVTT